MQLVAEMFMGGAVMTVKIINKRSFPFDSI